MKNSQKFVANKNWLVLSAFVLGMLTPALYGQDDPASGAAPTVAPTTAPAAEPAAQPQTTPPAPQLNRPQLNTTAEAGAQPQIVPKPPEINATSYILMDAMTGKVLVEKNADQALPPASLTKIMTTYVADTELAAGNISLDDQVNVSIKAWQAEGSKMFIQEGTTVRLEDIMRGIIIQSGNDASIALAEHIAGSEEAFADLMNQHARQLGMTSSYFLNASGLPNPDHVMSARDLATLARTIITRFPQQYKIYGEREFTYNNIRQPNRNSLLFTDPNVDGMKTGFTDDAGYCLVASSMREGMRLVTVVLGATSTDARAVETQKLLTFGFRFFENHQLFTDNHVLGNTKVWSGAADTVDVGIQSAMSVTVPRGQLDNLQTVLELNENIKAPITVGQELGKVRVSLGEEVFYDGPVVAMQDVERGSWIKRFMDWLHLFFLSFFS
ncbi:MAG: D-alanyl-D-alanine carboxypeptidase family protein [Pseudomonadota bacterium]